MNLFLPILFLFVFGYGLIRKRPIFSDFCDGVVDGLRVCFKLFPVLLLMLVSLSVFRSSGALDLFISLGAPLCDFLHIPSAILPLAIIRPLSGGGALSVCESLLREFGVDSFPGRVSSVLCASTETTFYTLGIYLPHGMPKGSMKFLICALFCDIITVFLSVYVCKI